MIRSGGLPKSTLGAAALAGTGVGAGAPQGLLSPPEDHGSNSGLPACEATGGLFKGAGAGLDTGCDERLNAELKSLPRIVVGEDTFGIVGEDALGAGIAGAGAVDAQPPKSSVLNKAAGMFVAGFGAGAGAGA